MAEMIVQEKGGKGGKPKPKKVSTRVDLTPMVDLGFLLITFFMLTTTLIKPQTMEIYMPSNKEENIEKQNQIKASQAITILIDSDNKLYYFFGGPKDGKDPELIQTDYSQNGLRTMLLTRNHEVAVNVEELRVKLAKREISDSTFRKLSADARAVKTAPVVVIKATDGSSYKNLVDVLDEMQICNIARYAIVDITDYDKGLIAKLNNAVDK
jgi:biopolymer transport protein ExbD